MEREDGMIDHSALRIEKEVRGDQALLKLSGAMTIGETASLRVELIRGLAHARELVLELGQVDDCDMFGIQLLHSAGKTARNSEKTIWAKGISAAVKEAAERIGMDIGESLPLCGE